MKKSELEDKVNQLTEENTNLLKEIERLNKYNKKLIEMDKEHEIQLKEKFQEILYNNWKEANEKFLIRYLENYLIENLTIELDSEGSSAIASLKLNDYEISSSTTWVG